MLLSKVTAFITYFFLVCHTFVLPKRIGSLCLYLCLPFLRKKFVSIENFSRIVKEERHEGKMTEKETHISYKRFTENLFSECHPRESVSARFGSSRARLLFYVVLVP